MSSELQVAVEGTNYLTGRGNLGFRRISSVSGPVENRRFPTRTTFLLQWKVKLRCKFWLLGMPGPVMEQTVLPVQHMTSAAEAVVKVGGGEKAVAERVKPLQIPPTS